RGGRRPNFRLVVLQKSGQARDGALGGRSHLAEGLRRHAANGGVLVLQGVRQRRHRCLRQRSQLAEDVGGGAAAVRALVSQGVRQGRHVPRGIVFEDGQGAVSVTLQLLVVVLDQDFQGGDGSLGVLADARQGQGGGAAHVVILVLEQIGEGRGGDA